MIYEGNCRLGDLFASRREKGRAGLPTLSVTLNDGLVNREDLDRKQDTTLTPEEHLLVRPGDIAYNMMRMWQGALGLASCEGMVSPAYVVLKPKEGIDPLFASYLFKTERMRYLFWAYSYGLTDDRLRLYFQDFSRIPVTIPPKEDQRKIAETLVTWDSTISATENLLKATMAQKRYLAEQLLSGVRSYSAERMERFLGGVAEIIMGSSPESSCYNSVGLGLPLIQGNADIKERLSNPKFFTSSTTRECFPGDILLSVRAPVGEVSKSIHHACIGRGMAAIRPKSGISPSYLYQVLLASEGIWAKLSQGSTFDAVTTKDVKKLKLQFPVAEAEQEKIAEVLGAADEQAEKLCKKLKLLRAEKQSLMQQLLTGKRRVRLPSTEAASA